MYPIFYLLKGDNTLNPIFYLREGDYNLEAFSTQPCETFKNPPLQSIPSDPENLKPLPLLVQVPNNDILTQSPNCNIYC